MQIDFHALLVFDEAFTTLNEKVMTYLRKKTVVTKTIGTRRRGSDL